MSDTRQGPTIIVEEATPEAIERLSGFEVSARTNPDAVIKALGVVSLDRNTVLTTLAFVEEHPEGGVKLVRELYGLLDTRSDIEVDFDPDTNRAIKNDTAITNVRANRRYSDSEKGILVRIRRLQIFAERTKEAA